MAAFKTARLSILLAESAALVAAWVTWSPPAAGHLRLALVYVLAAWVAAAGITLWIYLVLSWAPFPAVLAASLEVSAMAMWLVPGTLLLASRSQWAVAAGLAAVIGSACLLACSRPPVGETVQVRRRRSGGNPEPLLFREQPNRPAFSRGMLPAMLGALALEAGIYALAAKYPILAAVSFATATGIWIVAAVARGAMEARSADRVLYPLPGTLLTLLLTVTLTAVLVRKETVEENTDRAVASSPARAAPKAVVTRLVGLNGVPGVVLRPRSKPIRRLLPVSPGSRLRLSSRQPLAIPFTGEYDLYPTSTNGLPKDSIVETGTPLDNLFGTVSGGPMETVAVQTFNPSIDLTHCGEVLVALTSEEIEPLLASMQLVSGRRVEDGGTELMGADREREETLGFPVPATARPLLVDAIRILFQRPVDRNRSMRVTVQGFTLVPRGQ